MAGAGHANGAPAGIDLSRPNAARMYDFLLGGAHNFAADRRAALAVLAAAPQARDVAKANRRFLHRAVRYALDQGIRQFLDLGCGIPTTGGVHELVHAAHPDGRVLYADADPVVVEHTHALLEDTDRAGVIQADLRQPAAILDHHQTRRLIDFGQPVAVLLGSVLHFVPGPTSELVAIIADLMRPTATESLLVISHATATATATSETAEAVIRLYADTTTPLQLRTPAQVRALFGDATLITPDPAGMAPADLVPVGRWRPNPSPDSGEWPPEPADGPFPVGLLAGVGRKTPPAVAVTAGTTGSAIRPAGMRPRPRNTRFPNPGRARQGVPAARP